MREPGHNRLDRKPREQYAENYSAPRRWGQQILHDKSHFLQRGARYSLAPMDVLLTGASGFFGSVCAELLAHQKDTRLYLLRSGAGDDEPSIKTHTFRAPPSLSVNDLSNTLRATSISNIIHIGALASPEACEKNPSQANISNVLFTEMLSSYALTTGAHLTTISTDLVFDGGKAPPEGFCERDLPCPCSVYSRSKLAAEEATRKNSSHAVVRVALLYGNSPSQSKGFLGWMRRAFTGGNPVSLFEDEFRTPIHVRDAARAVLEVARHKLHGIFHCGGPERLSRVDFGKRVAEVYGFEAPLIRPTTRLSHTIPPLRPEDVSLNSHALFDTLGFTPRPVEEALHLYDKNDQQKPPG